MSPFLYSCLCGEEYLEESHAWDCHKCIEYLYDHDYSTRNVVKFDIRTNKVLETFTERLSDVIDHRKMLQNTMEMQRR